MNKSPRLLVILIKYKESEGWYVFHVSEENNLQGAILYITHCRKIARENNTGEKFKLQYYEPSN